jgi:hypothetical protein
MNYIDKNLKEESFYTPESEEFMVRTAYATGLCITNPKVELHENILWEVHTQRG